MTELSQILRAGMSASGSNDTLSVVFLNYGLSQDPDTAHKPFVCLLFVLVS